MEHPKLYENIMKDKDVISALDYLRERQHGIRTFNLIDMLQKEIPKYKKENELLKAKLELYQGALHREHETIHRANDLEDELTKYKRAFEILKSTNKITIQKLDWQTIDYLLRVDDLAFKLTKEQYELLEELMKGE